ncbi:hypothetical protein AB0B45_29680 [Nonomuraea sp. NPDC049152]|uniref:hypothetical protein n=1 Tax=Nonomuraea sp. NPDC049152 TaxID=3154350 RepID=UPI0033D9A22F
MDEMESRLVEVLGDPGETVPPPGLADRVHRGVTVRRRRRRVLALAAGACAVALAVAVPVAVRQAGGEGQTVAASVVGLEDLVDPAHSVTVPARTPEGKEFLPLALGEDGSLIGVGGKGDTWEIGPEGGPLRPLEQASSGALGAGPGVRVFAGGGFFGPLMCRDRSGITTAISPKGIKDFTPVWVSGGTIVGSDPLLRPWKAKGCTKGTTLPVRGEAVAFSYPDLFVVDPFDGNGLRQVDVDSGKTVARRPLPEGVNVRTGGNRWQLWLAAVNRDTFAWVVNGVLRTADRATWQVTEGRRALPFAAEMDWGGRYFSMKEKIEPGAENTYPHLNASLTAGNRLVAYTALGETPGWRSVVHDPRTGRSFELPGKTYAAGDWLVWLDGDAYRLAKVR